MNTFDLKTCSCCKQAKPLSEFTVNAASKDKKHPSCRACGSIKFKASYAKNRDKILAWHRNYLRTNRVVVMGTKNRWKRRNKTKLQETARAYYQRIKPMRREWQKNYRKQPLTRIAHTLRDRVRLALRLGRCRKPTLQLLGVSNIDQVRQHLESQFRSGMSWQTYGVKGWHIDHIKPISSFDLENPNQVAIAFHYTNLQPLWWQENFAKGRKVDFAIR